jgi:hypothetical protein
MRLRIGSAIVVAALVAVAAPASTRIPVHVGGADQQDACTGLVQVSGIGPRGFLAVRDGPGVNFRMLDRLRRGRLLTVCEERGMWLGVVYGEAGADCAVSSPRRRRTAYVGPCRSGWVHRRYAQLIAG